MVETLRTKGILVWPFVPLGSTERIRDWLFVVQFALVSLYKIGDVRSYFLIHLRCIVVVVEVVI